MCYGNIQQGHSLYSRFCVTPTIDPVCNIHTHTHTLTAYGMHFPRRHNDAATNSTPIHLMLHTASGQSAGGWQGSALHLLHVLHGCVGCKAAAATAAGPCPAVTLRLLHCCCCFWCMAVFVCCQAVSSTAGDASLDPELSALRYWLRSTPYSS